MTKERVWLGGEVADVVEVEVDEDVEVEVELEFEVLLLMMLWEVPGVLNGDNDSVWAGWDGGVIVFAGAGVPFACERPAVSVMSVS